MRSLARNESLTHRHYPGCMAGFLHILDYHHWHVKKLLPHKKHRHERSNHSPRGIETRDPEEAQAESFRVKQHDRKSVPKKGRRARNRILSFSLHSLLHRINPVHHFEPPENSGADAVIVPDKSEEVKPGEAGQKLGECVDFLEIFKENKDFFLKILQDPEACGDQVRGLKNSNIKVRLSKSKSFPIAKFSQARSPSIRSSSTLEHKQNEVWFFLDGDKSSGKDNDQAKQQTTTVSDGGWNQAVVSRFGDMKRKIKSAMDERRIEDDGGDKDKEKLEITIEHGDIDLGRRRRVQHRHVRRSSSLNESLDRYTQLFGDTFSRDSKLSHSRSLRLSTTTTTTGEERAVTPARKASRRNLSLPDLDSVNLLFSVGSSDALRLGMPPVKFRTSDAEESENLDHSDSLKVDENVMQEQLLTDPATKSASSTEDIDSVSRLSHEAELERCYSQGFEQKKSELVVNSEDFLYVKQLLEIFGEEEEMTWHSLDQPLSPCLFKQLEGYEEDDETASVNHEDEEESHRHNHHHHLLFDLVNETLGEMNEKSYTYFPRPTALSGGMAKGDRLLEEVWKRTRSSLSLRPELDKSLDDVVGRDLAKRDGRWMSLEWEKEMVALEIEDLVFDELLDEVLCCLA